MKDSYALAVEKYLVHLIFAVLLYYAVIMLLLCCCYAVTVLLVYVISIADE